MNIGVLGTGDVGRILAAGLAARGHEVMIGTRDPMLQKITDWLASDGKGVTAGTFADVVAFGEVLFLAVGWTHVEKVIQLAGPESFRAKVVIDATNPLRFESEGRPPVLAVGYTDSASESVQRWLPEAHVVTAFTIVGNLHMVDPDFPVGKPDMFVCGNDSAAKQTTGRLVEDLGWPAPIDLGGIASSRYLEPLAMIWITHFLNEGFSGNPYEQTEHDVQCLPFRLGDLKPDRCPAEQSKGARRIRLWTRRARPR